jgi:hypothetical protein
MHTPTRAISMVVAGSRSLYAERIAKLKNYAPKLEVLKRLRFGAMFGAK